MTDPAPSGVPSPRDPMQDLEAAVRGVINSRTARFLLIVFAAVELLNFAALPAALNTIKASTLQAMADSEEAKARAAKQRQRAEADLATADAALKAEQAKQAERYRKAEARKTTAEARNAEQAALNSPAVQEAKARQTQQEAIILREQATAENRRAKAQADKDRAEADLADLKATMTNQLRQIEYLKQRGTTIVSCVNQEFFSGGINDPMNIMGCGLLTDARRQHQLLVRFRRACVKEGTIPNDQIHPLCILQKNNPDLPDYVPDFCGHVGREYQLLTDGYRAFAVGSHSCGATTRAQPYPTQAEADAAAIETCNNLGRQRGATDCRVVDRKSAQAIAAPPVQPEPAQPELVEIVPNVRVTQDCAQDFASWKSFGRHKVFMSSEAGGCGWSYNSSSIAAARATALRECNATGNTNCKIVAER
jgi:hypothetical protein